MTGFAIYEFPFGLLKIAYEDSIVVFLKRVTCPDDFGQRTEFTGTVFSQVIEYLDGKRREFDFPYKLKGTEFQIKVWEELLRIPYGETRTYKEIATAIGNPRTSRAVGLANNKNPVTIVVPCHRVIGSDGHLVGYAGGLDMKIALLEIENQR
ncbi:MAG: methylated-DNA--[protein]-cysteine S-methyltransferase [Ruminococcaceae bacterium]|nr:methylated-DNA--[protein]-cysteine S-methyltransferase [Oscillospiraceae bacterium]